MQYDFEALQALCVEQEFYECEMGVNIKARVITAPVLSFDKGLGKHQLRWEAVNAVNLTPISYLVTKGMMHYGPFIYTEPQYIKVRGGELTYDLLGEK